VIGFIILAIVLSLSYLAICFSVLVEIIKLFKDRDKEAIPLLIMLIMVVLILVSFILIALGI
jgi:hypothetical protein